MIAGIAGALIGAGVGAGIWAAVIVITEHELGIVAWAVGGIVGFGAQLLGGRGVVMGFICAILALVAIFAGKYIGVKMMIEKEWETMSAQFFTWEEYQTYLREAKAYESVDTVEEMRAFMFENDYTDAMSAEEITQEEIDDFVLNSEPSLKEASRNPPDYESWKSERKDQAEAFMAAMGDDIVIESIKEDLGLFDLVFGLLGLATAFKVGATGFETGGE